VQVALIALLLAGCNQIYDLDQTRLRDGAAPDAPPMCTSAAPVFRGEPVPVIIAGEYARSYSISLDRRIAVANVIGGIIEGPGDSALMTRAIIEPSPPGLIGSPRLSPEGDELFVRYAEPGGGAAVHRYAREGNVWAYKAKLFFVMESNQPDISIPTRKELGPRRLVVGVNTNELREYVEGPADQWTQLGAPYSPSDLDVATIILPNISSDGLRLVFQGQQAGSRTLLYASRANVTERFGKALAANPFFGNPDLYDPYLLEDCSRLYFFAISTPPGVYYVEP